MQKLYRQNSFWHSAALRSRPASPARAGARRVCSWHAGGGTAMAPQGAWREGRRHSRQWAGSRPRARLRRGSRARPRETLAPRACCAAATRRCVALPGLSTRRARRMLAGTAAGAAVAPDTSALVAPLFAAGDKEYYDTYFQVTPKPGRALPTCHGSVRALCPPLRRSRLCEPRADDACCERASRRKTGEKGAATRCLRAR